MSNTQTIPKKQQKARQDSDRADRHEGKAKSRTVRRVNWWVVAATLLVVGLGAPLAYFLHHIQSGRIMDALQMQIDSAEAAGDVEKAAKYAVQYHRLKPEDPAGIRRIAALELQLLEDDPNRRSAIPAFYAAMGVSTLR